MTVKKSPRYLVPAKWACPPTSSRRGTYLRLCLSTLAFASKKLPAGFYGYNYVTDSDMVGTTDYPNNLSATRSYESNRNLVDYVQNDVSGTVISKYDYENDAAGRRTDVVTTGTAFSADTFNKYGYNTRSVVIGVR